MADSSDSPNAATQAVASVNVSAPVSRMSAVRWQIVAMLMGFALLGHFNRVSITVAANARFIGPGLLTPEQMGQVYSAFLFVYTLCMLPGGWFIDRAGPRLAMAGMGIGTGLCVILTGAIGWTGLPVASLFVPLLFVRGIAGFCSTPLHPGAARSVSLWLPLTSRSTANGIVTAGALIGISFTYPVFGWLLGKLDWQLAFVACGFAMMLFSGVWLLLAADAPQVHPRVNDAEREWIQCGSTPAPASRMSLLDFRSLFLNRSLVLLTLSYAALSYFQYLFFYWIEFYFGKVLELPEVTSRRASFLVTMAMAVGMAAGGVLADGLARRIGHRWSCALVAMSGMLLSAVFGWIGVAVRDPNSVVLMFSLALGALGLCEGIFWTSAPSLEPRQGGLACAFLNTIGNAGGILAPACTPWIARHYGWSGAITVASIICGCGAVFWLWIGKPDSSAVKI